MPKVKPYATFCDTFCDVGAFSIKQSERVLKTAQSLGFRLKIHTNEFKDIGGVSLAINLEAVSADHLDNTKHRDIVILKESSVICVLLPGVPFFLMKDTYLSHATCIKKEDIYEDKLRQKGLESNFNSFHIYHFIN